MQEANQKAGNVDSSATFSGHREAAHQVSFLHSYLGFLAAVEVLKNEAQWQQFVKTLLLSPKRKKKDKFRKKVFEKSHDMTLL